MKVIRTTRKTTTKIPRYTMPKTIRKKLHQVMKENDFFQICRRVMATKMKLTAEPMPITTTATTMATATAEVTGIPALEEDPKNG